MKILALDQASHISGWAYFENNKLTKYGVIKTDEENIGERLLHIRNEIKQLINTLDIDQLIIEDIQLQNNIGGNVKTFKILAEVFGVIYELATEEEVPVIAVLSSVWKSKLGIKGKARAEQKRAAQQYVVDTYGIKPIQDICDAICIGASQLEPSNELNWE